MSQQHPHHGFCKAWGQGHPSAPHPQHLGTHLTKKNTQKPFQNLVFGEGGGVAVAHPARRGGDLGAVRPHAPTWQGHGGHLVTAPEPQPSPEQLGYFGSRVLHLTYIEQSQGRHGAVQQLQQLHGALGCR